MRIVAFSDTHKNIWGIYDMLKKQPNADWYVFLGDGQDEFEEIKELYPHKNFVAVKGNCDSFSTLPTDFTIDVNGVKVLCTHGHNYYVKSGTGVIFEKAKQMGAKIILHGHTHTPNHEVRDGIHLICPGALSGYKPTFAWIDITEKGILHNIVEQF